MRVLILAAALSLSISGITCWAQDSKRPSPPDETTASDSQQSDADSAAKTTDKSIPVALKNGVAKLSPSNTKIEFVGTHEGAKPDPRIGGFKKFTGKLTMNSENTSIESLTMEIKTVSLSTEIGKKLTDHLKSPDFLDVKKYPEAKFVSTQIADPDSNGIIMVTGDFTLMGQTNEIMLPVELEVTEAGVTLASQFQIDRTSFGMNKMTDRVAKAVSINLSVGEKTGGSKAKATTAMQTPPNRDRRRGGFDPDALFKRWDADNDGKLAGKEIPPRMKEQITNFDTDGDGQVSLEEWQIRVRGPGGSR